MQNRVVMCILLGASVVAGGCAQDVGDIDRTQPNKLRKDVFVGDPADPTDDPEWYMRQTIVGTPGTAFVGITGWQGDMDRVRFNIEEGLLVAHRVYEDVLGIDSSETPLSGNVAPAASGLDFQATGADYLGSPVAAFPIAMHFDVQRSYNPATGEQANVIVENPADRHWTDREWMRVRWSNLIATFDNNMFVTIDSWSQAEWYDGSENEAAPLAIECKDTDGNWLECDAESVTDDANVAYFEIVNNYVWYPDFVSCLLTFGFPWGSECGPETITVKTSFSKVDEVAVQSYEPRVYSDQEMEWFGFFRTNRCAYDRLYGCRDQTRVSLAQRHNLWTEWYRDTDEDGYFTPGIDERIPFAERGTQPIVYYVSDNWPVELYEDAINVADQYNEAFTTVVRENGNASEMDMFVLCANNAAQMEEAVAAGLPQDQADRMMAGYGTGACERPDYVKTIGDVRYSYFNWVDEVIPGMRGLLGYGPSSVDPVTGEIVSGVANMYGAEVDRYAQSVVDIADLINQRIDPEDYGLSEDLDGYFADIYDRFRYPGTDFDFVGDDDDVNNTDLDPDAGSAGVTPQDLERYESFDERLAGAKERSAKWKEKGIAPAQTDLAELRLKPTNNPAAIWQNLKDTEHEVRFVTEEMKVGLGMGIVGPHDPTTDEVVEMMGPRTLGMPQARGVDPNYIRAAGGGETMKGLPKIDPGNYEMNPTDGRVRFDTFASRNMYMAEFIDSNVIHIARYLEQEFGSIGDPIQRRLLMFEHVRKIITRHLIEHELGHTLGLRHNFEASYDSMNYDPEYWRIRGEGDQQLQALNRECPGLEGQGIMLGDPHCPSRGVIDQDWEKGQQEYAYSSTMEYGQSMMSTSHGIGLYDHAALAYAYGDLIHVFADDAVPNKVRVQLANTFGTLADPADIRQGTQSVMGTNQPITDWDDIDVVNFDGTYDIDGDGQSSVDDDDDFAFDWFDGNLDYWHYSFLPIMFGATDNGDMSAMYNREWMKLEDYGPTNNPTRLRVPYRFCSDFLNGSGPYCATGDDGADMNEMSARYEEKYLNDYFTTNYRRGRVDFGLWVWPSIARKMYYFNRTAAMYQHWYVRAASWTAWQSNPYGGGLQQVGIEDGMRHLINVVMQPHPGTYEALPDGSYENVSSDTGVAVDETFGPRLDLEAGLDVRYRFTRYDYDSGYYWFLKYRILSSFYDRWVAMMALVSPEYNDIGVDASSDITAYMIPYYLLYSTELSRAFGSVMTEDLNFFAPRVNLQVMGASGNTRDALEFYDPLASSRKLQDYADPTKYAVLNPYAGAYGNSGFNDRYFATIYSLAFFQVLWDKSFNHAANIQIINNGGLGTGFADTDGDGVLDIAESDTIDVDMNGIAEMFDPNEQPPVDRRPDIIQYKDPFNGQVYAAVRYTQTISPLYSVGIQILRRAENMKFCWQNPNEAECAGTDFNEFDLRNIREDIEVIMDLNAIMGGAIGY